MAKLHRLVKLDDRQNTHVYTFILPINIGTDTAKEIISSEFLCGHQKWNIKLTKQEKESHIGAYLTLKNPTPGLFVTADFGFSMLNRGHYTANESFMDTGKVFSKQQPTQGRKSFISSSDVKNPKRGFIMAKEQLFVEVTLCNIRSHFEYQLQLPMTEKDKAKFPLNDIRLETGIFPFGAMEWNINLRINERNPTDVRGGSTVTLKRLSNYDHYCKFNYRIHVGTIEPTPISPVKVPTSTASSQSHPKALPNHLQQKVITSPEMSSLFTNADTPDKVVLPTNIYKVASPKGVITIKIECYQVVSLSLLTIPMDKNRHKAMKCYDRDKQVWHFEAHMKSERLKFYIFYGDIATIPRNCIRMMTIGVSVLPAYGNQKLVNAVNSPYTRYYIQQPQDDFGLEVPMPIMMKEIIDANSIYVYDHSNTMTVQVEWRDSLLLKDVEYTMTDNVIRAHKLQMFKEMSVLQKENLILEKQVHSYQTAIAQKDSKGEYDLNQMAPRPQPPGQAQPGYSDTHSERTPNTMQDPFYRNINSPQNQLGASSPHQSNGQYSYSNTGMQTPGLVGQGGTQQGIHGHMMPNQVGYDTGYSRADQNMHDPYDRQHGRGQMDGSSLPVPGTRGPRSKSADPSCYSPVPERRAANRRNSSAGGEYTDYLEHNPRQSSKMLANNYDGYRSDCDYRTDHMAKPNGPQYNEHYGKDGTRPMPSTRTSKPSDSRSDYGDYYSERRSKTSYERDFDMYSDRGHQATISKSGSGGRSRSQPVSDGRRNMLNSTMPTGRASYAGYDSDYVPSDNGRGGSSYPSTPRSSMGQRGTAYHRADERRLMENGPH
ncbi:uncharacterized protein [Watersipora subatra]|uniref:uncharacterized protein n=1 Tax=Watersipora subatra TaxID=2589382 RepID=UPI00355B5C23